MLLLEPLLAFQDSDSHHLGALEIGVHMGRYLIALHNACAPGTRSLGVDLFDDQAKNVDKSGYGDLSTARQNVQQYAREPDLVELRSGDSLQLNEQDQRELLQEYRGFRIVSVDGGHTPIHVIRDSHTAWRLMHPGGYVVIDDFFNTNYPGVTEGLYELLRSGHTPLVPVIVTRKKLFLCHVSYWPRYWGEMTSPAGRASLGEVNSKSVDIAGHRCLSIW
jgi:hypothetical protein